MSVVSVIIPTYNRSCFVKEAVESVLKQTLPDFDIVLVDDGSTDDTADVIKKIPDARLRYFYKENGGISSARNLGLVKALGKYIAFLDSDDLYTERYLEVMTGRLEENKEFGMAYSLFANVFPDGRRKSGFERDRFFTGCLTNKYFERLPYILPSATVLRREVLKDFYFDEHLKFFEDIDFFLRLSTKTKFLCVPDASVIRRITDGSLVSEVKRNICPNIALILERFFYHYNDSRIVPVKSARKKISREYRSLAREHYRRGHRNAAIQLFGKAINQYPFDVQYYRGLLRALLLSRKNDKMPDWQMPEHLPPFILYNQNVVQC